MLGGRVHAGVLGICEVNRARIPLIVNADSGPDFALDPNPVCLGPPPRHLKAASRQFGIAR